MCKGGAWKGESVWHCSDGETKRTAIEGAKAGRKKETESRSPVIAGGLLKALLGVIQRSLDRLAGLGYLTEINYTVSRIEIIKRDRQIEISSI